MRKSLLAALILSFSNLSFAQSEGAMPFLTIHPSAFYFSSGHIGVTDPLNDPYGFYFNPAALGKIEANQELAVFHDPTNRIHKDWRAKYGNFGLSFKKNLNTTNLKLPITVGASILTSKFDYVGYANAQPDDILLADNDAFDSFWMVSFGIGYKYFANFRLGFSYKSATSDLGNVLNNGNLINYKDDISTYSYGLLVDIPFTQLINPLLKVDLDEISSIHPTLDLSVGASLLDYADEVNYGFGEGQEDPINRTARIGYTIKFGYEIDYGSARISLLDYFFNVEASDVLINRNWNSSDPFEYEAMYNDLQPLKNLIALEGNSGIIVHKAHLFSLLETIVFGYDSQTGKGIKFADVHGIVIKSDGLFKLLAKLTNNETLDYITEHFNFRYSSSSFNSDHEFNPQYENFSITYKGFEF